MFIAHNAVAFAARPAAPKISLGVLFAAAMFADLLWPVLVLLGVEHFEVVPGETTFLAMRFTHYPWSHSLLMVAMWALVFGAIYGAVTRDGRGAVVTGACVLSHWILDVLVHRPDLPLYPGGPVVGIGLWHSFAGTVIVELAIFLAGAAVYVTTTRPRDRIGTYGLAGLVVLIVASYVASWSGPPTGMSQATIAATGLVGGLVLVALSWWVDRHRDVVMPARAAWLEHAT